MTQKLLLLTHKNDVIKVSFSVNIHRNNRIYYTFFSEPLKQLCFASGSFHHQQFNNTQKISAKNVKILIAILVHKVKNKK
jgi:hypothetical protein